MLIFTCEQVCCWIWAFLPISLMRRRGYVHSWMEGVGWEMWRPWILLLDVYILFHPFFTY
jgi:hypothetical protein